MQYLEQEIVSLTQHIWGATLNLAAIPAEASAVRSSSTIRGVVRGSGPASLHAKPARSTAQARANEATSGRT